MLDGNLAALREYEKKVDEADRTYEMFLEAVKPMLKDLEDALDDIYYLVDYYERVYGYNFDEDAGTLIQEVLEAR